MGDSYLIEITRDILAKKVGGESKQKDMYVVDTIMDKAGQKGTGKWTGISALDLGMPLTLIAEAVFARCLSAQKDERVKASKVLKGPETPQDLPGTKKEIVEAIRDALYASKIVSYAQGFVLIRAASDEFKWDVNLGACALMWRGGCIIRSKFLGNIKEAFDKNPDLSNLMMDIAQQGYLQTCYKSNEIILEPINIKNWKSTKPKVIRRDNGITLIGLVVEVIQHLVPMISDLLLDRYNLLVP